MMGRLDGKVAVVTAAAQGIGRATCETFSREGATVYALDINVEKLKELEACTGDIRTRRVDVTSKEEIEKFTEDVPSVDILFNCAGYVFMGTLLETEERDWDFSFDLNIKSMFLLTKAVLPKMLKQKSGSIINIASVASTIKALPNECVYATTKAAVIGFTKSIAVDYVKDGIRANSICPGSIETPSLQMRMSEIEDGRNKFMSRQPSGRLGKPQEVANVALFLASDEASFVSGSEYKVDNCWSA